MLPEVDQTILEAIRENVSTVPKSTVVIQKSQVPPKKIPAIYLWNRGFTASDLSIGANAPETGDIVEDVFDGDARKTTFKLSTVPLRPLLLVETPANRVKKEGRDFTVDYSAGSLTLLDPPERGRKNMRVRYHSAKGSGEVKGLRVKLIYNVDVWASEQKESGSIVNEVASILLKTRESFESKGIQLKLTRGRDLTARDGIPDGVFCKRLECVAEADMFVKIPIPRIEKIELKRVEQSKTQ